MLGQVFRNATDQEELKLEIGFQVHAYKAILFTANSLCLFFYTRTVVRNARLTRSRNTCTLTPFFKINQSINESSVSRTAKKSIQCKPMPINEEHHL